MESFYIADGPDRFQSLGSTAGPWGSESQHGGPPAALLARAVESLPAAHDRVVGRFTTELLGPVPVGPVRTEARVVRSGRTVSLVEASLYDVACERRCAAAAAWLFPATGEGPGPVGQRLPHGPEDGCEHARPESWSGGYLDHVEWRWVRGSVERAGPALVWMRPRVPLLAGEPLSPLQRLLVCVDSASGVSAVLDPSAWGFLNTELTVHMLRPASGDWLCLDAETTLGPGSVGLAVSSVHDERGLVARSAQALLVLPRLVTPGEAQPRSQRATT